MNSLFSTAVLLVSLFCFLPLLIDATWTPAVGDSYFIDLVSGDSISMTNPGTAATVYDVNATSTSQSTIAALQALGIAVVCYVPIGAASTTDADYASLPSAAIGNPVPGYTYRYLDVNNIDIYPVIEARIDAAAAKGCDGIDLGYDAEYGNATYGINTGFNLTVAEALLYYQNMANYARQKNLIVGLRNGPAFVDEVVNEFADFAIITNCFYVDHLVRGTAECSYYNPFIASGKPVFAIENFLPLSKFCKRASKKQFFAGSFPLSLNGTYAWCSSLSSVSPSAAAVSPAASSSAPVAASSSAVAASPSVSNAASSSVSPSASNTPSIAPTTSPSVPASPSASSSSSLPPTASASVAPSPSASSTSTPALSPSTSVSSAAAASASPAISPSSANNGYCITCTNGCGSPPSPLYTKCTSSLNGTATAPTANTFCCAADISNGFSYSWSANGANCSSTVAEHKLGQLCSALSGTVSCATTSTAGRVMFTCS